MPVVLVLENLIDGVPNFTSYEIDEKIERKKERRGSRATGSQKRKEHWKGWTWKEESFDEGQSLGPKEQHTKKKMKK
jgi:hypothetical protein